MDAKNLKTNFYTLYIFNASDTPKIIFLSILHSLNICL